MIMALNAYAHDPQKECEQGCYQRFLDCSIGPMNTTELMYACMGNLTRCKRTCELESGVCEEEEEYHE